jgi:hypothetical protein
LTVPGPTGRPRYVVAGRTCDVNGCSKNGNRWAIQLHRGLLLMWTFSYGNFWLASW